MSKVSNNIHILNGHFLDKKNVLKFEAQVKYLANRCNFVSISKAVSLIESRIQVEKPHIAFTFDDGLTDMYESVAPVLERYGATACFFINPGFIDGDHEYKQNFRENVIVIDGAEPMTWTQVRELNERGHTIGSHTVDHLDISKLDKVKLRDQLKNSKDLLELKLNCKIEYFAYPYGQLHHINEEAYSEASKHYSHVFSGVDAGNYYSRNSVLNRRHIEPHWPISHLKYFLSVKRSY